MEGGQAAKVLENLSYLPKSSHSKQGNLLRSSTRYGLGHFYRISGLRN